MKILNFGSLNLDHVYRVPHFTAPGETLSAEMTEAFGGKGLNQSVALARAGAEVWHAGCMGRGGEELVAFLRENGVRTDHIKKTDAPQGNAVIEVTDSGENRIIICGGSNLALDGEYADSVMDSGDFTAGDIVLLQNEVSAVGHIIRSAKKRGMKVVLNPSPFNEKLSGIDWSALDWAVLNEVEAAQLSGVPIASGEDADRAAEKLRAVCPAVALLITLGAGGSVCYTPDGKTFRQPVYPVKAVDTTAAGDTFTGYFLASLCRGEEIPLCLRRAAAASSVAITRLGAAPSVPYSAETDEFLEKLL